MLDTRCVQKSNIISMKHHYDAIYTRMVGELGKSMINNPLIAKGLPLLRGSTTGS
jgi:hypothetical protein